MPGADLRDRALNIPGSEGTSKYEVLCSDVQLNEANSINSTPTLFPQVSIRSKRNFASFPDAPVESTLTFVDSTSCWNRCIPHIRSSRPHASSPTLAPAPPDIRLHFLL